MTYGGINMFKPLDDVFSNFEESVTWLFRERKQAEKLAGKVEVIVRELSHLPPASAEKIDLISTLNHISILLERFLERPELLSKTQQDFSDRIEKKKPLSIQIVPESKHENELKLSSAAKDLIGLRDWVLLAKAGQSVNNPQVLDIIYQKLGEILEKEGVTTLEETGLVNYEKHQVISTQVTDDPKQNECICHTIRPGYLFRGELIRPQEVIVYSCAAILDSDK